MEDKIKELQKASNEFIERRPYNDMGLSDGNFNYIHQDRVHDLIENAFKKGSEFGSQLTVDRATEKIRCIEAPSKNRLLSDVPIHINQYKVLQAIKESVIK